MYVSICEINMFKPKETFGNPLGKPSTFQADAVNRTFYRAILGPNCTQKVNKQTLKNNPLNGSHTA